MVNTKPPPRSRDPNAPSLPSWQNDELEYADMQQNLEEVDDIIDESGAPWSRMREGTKRRAKQVRVRAVDCALPNKHPSPG